MKRRHEVLHVFHKHCSRSLRVMVHNNLKPSVTRDCVTRVLKRRVSHPLVINVCCHYVKVTQSASPFCHIQILCSQVILETRIEFAVFRCQGITTNPLHLWSSTNSIPVRCTRNWSQGFSSQLRKCSVYRGTSVRGSSSHPQLSYVANGGGGAGVRGSASGGRCDQGTQTPDNISRETRNFRLRSLKLHLSMGPSTLNLR
jgi:hypothetical protein